MTFHYTGYGTVPGYAEAWNGSVNAANTAISGSYTPNNGALGGAFALQPL